MTPRPNTVILMQSYRRPSISLIPLVHDNDDLFGPPGQESSVNTPVKRYQVSRRGILSALSLPCRSNCQISFAAAILSAAFFTVLILLAIFIALFTSFVQAQESVAAAASIVTASGIPP